MRTNATRCRVVPHVGGRDCGSVADFLTSYLVAKYVEVDVAFADLLAMCVIDLNTIVCHRYWCIFSSIYFIYIQDIEDTLAMRRGFPVELAADVHEMHISQGN